MKRKKFILISFLFLVLFQFSDKCRATGYGYDYANPLTHSTWTSFFGGLLISIQNLVGILAVVFIVIGGVIYITAGGKDSQITLAKNTIISALIGFTLAIAGPSLLKEIQTLAASGDTTGAATIANANPIGKILKNVLDFVLTIVGVLSLISLTYSGLTYLTSKGSRENADKAKRIALYSIIALTVAGGSLILVNELIWFLT